MACQLGIFLRCARSNLAGTYSSSIFSFLTNHHADSYSGPTSVNEGSSLPVSPLGFVVTCSPDGSHSDWDEMESHSTFKLP